MSANRAVYLFAAAASLQSCLTLMSDSVQPHRRQPTRLPRPWDSPGKIHFPPGTLLVSLCYNNVADSAFPVGCLRKGRWLCSPVLVGRRRM